MTRPKKLAPLSIIGVELGARMETTALSVTERNYVPTGEVFEKPVHGRDSGPLNTVPFEKIEPEYRVRHLERRNPPVLYGRTSERVAEIVKTVGGGLVVVDITRVGRPALALIREAINRALSAAELKSPDTVICPVTITGIAGGVSLSSDAGWLVPRRDLVSQSLLLFEADRIKIAEGLDLAGTLSEEFQDFKPKPDVRDDLEGWRLNRNDDLVLSVAMSVWAAERFLSKEESAPLGSLSVPAAV